MSDFPVTLGGWNTGSAMFRIGVAIAVGMLVIANLAMVGLEGALILSGSDAVDLASYREAVSRFPEGTLYASGEWWYAWRYSPLAVPIFIPFVLLGETAWRLLHFAALLGLRGSARWLALASYPFWFDVAAGNVMIFIAVAVYWALRGNRVAIALTLLVSLIIPRPMMLPVVGWLLWKHQGWRWPFAVAFAIHLAGVVASGYGPAWLTKLSSSMSELGSAVNVGPSAIIGLWWLVIAVPLCAWCLVRDRPASAGLLLQPYWLPYYLLMPLVDRWGGLQARFVARDLLRHQGQHSRR